MGRPSKKSSEQALVKAELGVITPTEVLPPLQPQFAGGYDPIRLDPVLGDLIESAGVAAQAFNKVLPLLARAAQDLRKSIEAEGPASAVPELLADRAERTASVVEKASRIVVQLAKALDGLTRLRSLLAGGPDRRIEEIGRMSEKELMALVYAVIQKCPKCGHRFAEPA